MKCEECGGTGKVQKWFYERTGFGKYEKVCGDVKCEWCNGTGEVEQTEQEYLQTCNTEQLAEFLTKFILDDKRFRMTMVGGVNETKLWLKQPHTTIKE